MKRSEALADIKKELYTIVYNLDENWEEQLLTAIEEMGMLPPSVPAVKIKGKDYKWGAGCTMRCSCDDCDPSFPMQKWEKE